MIITNAKIDKTCSELIKTEKLTIKTWEEMLQGLFDFESYHDDLSTHANSDELSSHYIEVYGTEKLPINEGKGAWYKGTYQDINEDEKEYN